MNYGDFTGYVFSDIEESHESFGKKFYQFQISISRLSETVDMLNVIVGEDTPNLERLSLGTAVTIQGSVRSVKGDNGTVKIFIFADDISILDEKQEMSYENSVTISGHIVTGGVLKTTHTGRTVHNFGVGAERTNAQSRVDYIPCITWGINAIESSKLPRGTEITCIGRLQSRLYKKRVDENKYVTKVAYELSVSDYTTKEDEK